MEPSALDIVPPSSTAPTPSSSRKRKREGEKVVLGDSFVIGVRRPRLPPGILWVLADRSSHSRILHPCSILL